MMWLEIMAHAGGTMWTKTVETTLSPALVVEGSVGDLTVQGIDEPRLTISLSEDAGAVSFRPEGETIFLTLRADARLACPRQTRLTLSAVRGDLRLGRVLGSLQVGTVSGDAVMRQVGPVEGGEIYGDLSIHGAAGPVSIGEVFGDARLREVDGPLTVGAVRGDLHAAGLRGGATVGTVGADLILRPPYVSGAVYRFSVGGKAHVVIPADAGLRLILRAGGRIRSTVPGLALTEEQDAMVGVLGDGGALLEIAAAGHILLVPEIAEEAEWGPWATGMEGIGAAVEASIAQAMATMEARLAEALRAVDSEEIRRQVERATERAREAIERYARRAQEAAEREAERARRQAEREAERARREAERARIQAERAQRRWQRASGQRPQPARPAAIDEEILRVLRLVEEGKITPEQAAELIAALEGR